MINWELCEKLKFNHTSKGCMHKPESVFENETHKILGDHLILARRSHHVMIDTKKRIC